MHRHDSWGYFKWLLSMSIDWVRLPIFGWACLILTVGLVLSLAWQRPFGSGRWKPYYTLVLTQFLFFPAVVAVGALYGDIGPKGPVPTGNPVAEFAIYTMFFLSLALSLFWVYRMKGLRWFASCLVALHQVFLFFAVLVAHMSISGDWI